MPDGAATAAQDVKQKKYVNCVIVSLMRLMRHLLQPDGVGREPC
jgi:hypothetical protein